MHHVPPNVTQFPPKTLYCRLGGPSWPIMAPNGASSFVTVLYLMSSSLLCKRLRSRSTCNTTTAHSTSYYTLDKLQHIRQASTHSTSYRTHTLKSIPPISVYTQVRSHRTYYKRTVRSTNIPSVVQPYRPWNKRTVRSTN